MNTTEYHVASFIAHALPEKTAALSDFITQQAGLEVHAVSPEGKVVFTAEGDSQKAIANQTDIIKQHGDVLTLSPIYHQFLDEQQTSHKDAL